MCTWIFFVGCAYTSGTRRITPLTPRQEVVIHVRMPRLHVIVVVELLQPVRDRLLP